MRPGHANGVADLRMQLDNFLVDLRSPGTHTMRPLQTDRIICIPHNCHGN